MSDDNSIVFEQGCFGVGLVIRQPGCVPECVQSGAVRTGQAAECPCCRLCWPSPCSLLVLLIVALFYAGAAVIYKLALPPSKDQRLAEAQRQRRARRD